MIRFLVVAFSCLVVARTSRPQTDAPKQAQKQSVQGKVVDAKSGQPIRKVAVYVMGGLRQSFERYSSATGEDGTFAIENLKPGRYIVTLERTGLVQAATARGVTTFVVQPGQSLSGLVFKMEAAGAVAGKIVDIDGDPIARVSVRAEIIGTPPWGSMEGLEGAVTNDLGEYRIGNLRPGKYWIYATPMQRVPVVRVEGKAKERLIYARPTYYPGTVDKTQALAVEVHSGEVSANFSVLMTHLYRVSGTVGVSSGQVVHVHLMSQSGGPVGPEALGEDGKLGEGNRFEYQSVLPGTYMAMAYVVKGMLTDGQPDMQVLQLKPSIEVGNADVEGLQLHDEPAGQIRGTFRSDTGEKIDWTQLTASVMPIVEATTKMRRVVGGSAASGALAGPPKANSDGSFEIKNVAGGNYQLVVGTSSDQLRDYYTKSVIFGGRDVTDSGFAPNGDVQLDVVVSPKGATIEGNVVDSNGQPVPYCTVAVVPNLEHRARPDSYQQQPTDERGHFIARGLYPGSYMVLAFAELFLQEDIRQPEFLKTYGGKGETVELGEGTRKSITTRIVPTDTEAP